MSRSNQVKKMWRSEDTPRSLKSWAKGQEIDLVKDWLKAKKEAK